MRKWFISDLHFGHNNILKYQKNRDFGSVERMDEHIINSWNKYIAKKDLVYVIGDFSFHDFEKTKEIMGRLNGEIILILGNHDKFRKYTIHDWVELGFKDVKDEEIVRLSNGVQYLLKHYPYAQGFFGKLWKKISLQKKYFRPYMAFYPVDAGMWHIHGHFHGGKALIGRQINVNVDTWNFKPVSEAQIIKMTGHAGYFKKKIMGLKNKIMGLIKKFTTNTFY